MIIDGAEIVSINDSGQKHIFFKHKPGLWQLDDMYVVPDIKRLKYIHLTMCNLMRLGFSQEEIKTGTYKLNRIQLIGMQSWRLLENELKKYRYTRIFYFASWMLFISEDDRKAINQNYKKRGKNEKEQMNIFK